MQPNLDVDFKSLAKKETNARMQLRLLALANFKEGMSRYKIAECLKVSRTSVNKWVADFLKYGLEGLQEEQRTGRPTRLTDEQLEMLTQFIEKHAIKADGGRLQGRDVQRYILESFDVDYKLSNIYRLMNRLGFSWITSRSRHPQQSQEVQDAFKKFPTVNDPSHSGSSST